MLHISQDEQKQRLLARLDEPAKLWKYSSNDLKERAFWGDYMDAYQKAFEKTGTEAAPWHVVPANKKWYARIAVQQLLLDALEASSCSGRFRTSTSRWNGNWSSGPDRPGRYN